MNRKPRGTFKAEKLGKPYEETLDQSSELLAVQSSDAADQEDNDCRVNFRWGRQQVALIKQAASMMGVSYQQYIKQCTYRQAMLDILQARNALSQTTIELSKQSTVVYKNMFTDYFKDHQPTFQNYLPNSLQARKDRMEK